MSVAIPTFIPLAHAARKYNIPENVLTRLIQDGTIEAAQLPSGELVVSDNDVNRAKTKDQLIEEKYSHLRKRPVTVTEAVEKYRLHRNTVLEWVKKEYIAVLEPGYRMELDEADVAYCAAVYHERKTQGTVFGSRIFSENGDPYYLKHPELAVRRRKGTSE